MELCCENFGLKNINTIRISFYFNPSPGVYGSVSDCEQKYYKNGAALKQLTMICLML